jgi:hypothetical protein
VLAGEGGAGGHEVGWRASEDDPATVVADAGTDGDFCNHTALREGQ